MIEIIKERELKKPSNEMFNIQGHGNVKVIKLGKGIKCVDDRPLQKISNEENALSIKNEHRNRMPENYENAASIPGGSLGLAMIAKKVLPHLSPREAVNLIIDWSKFTEIPMSIHAHCGHLNLATENGKEYGLENDDMRKMSGYLGTKADNGEIIINEANLFGEHNAKYVQIIITDENDPKTVEQIDSNGEKSFRLDETANKWILRSLASFIIEQNRKELSEKIIQDTVEELNDKMYETYDSHVNITFGKLGADLPIFEDNLTGEIPTVMPKGFIKPIPHRA